MILFSLGIILAIISSFIIVYLFTRLFKKLNKLPITGGVIGFFISVPLGILMVVMPGRIYIIDGNNSYQHYLSFIASEYIMNNDEKVSVNVNLRSTMVINDTRRTFSLQKVVYGGSNYTSGSETKWIYPNKYYHFPISNITYFFDGSSAPHESIRAKDEEVIRYWLREFKE